MCPIETDMKRFREELRKNTYRGSSSAIVEYDEALEQIRERLNQRIKAVRAEQGRELDVRQKDKDYLLQKKKEYKEYVQEIFYSENLRVAGYEGELADVFINEVVNEFVGLDVLEAAYFNPAVTDIYCLAWDKLYIEENGVNVKLQKTFRSPEHYKNFIFRIVNEAGKELNNGISKKVDFELYGDRYCATSMAISPSAYSLTIRKHPEDHVRFQDILNDNILSKDMAELMRLLIKGERNIIYAGITGTGKTTSIRAILDHYVTSLNKRIIVCEETQELFLENDHTLDLVASKSDDKKSSITLYDLIITCLRLKPKYIVVGEVRAEEAEAAVEAMETGHSTIFTMHGGRPINCINRLVTKYLIKMPTLGIEVVERIIGSAVDYIWVQDNIPGIGRRVTEVAEVDYDFVNKCVRVTPIYKYDFKTNDFVLVNKIHPEKADLMLRRGVLYDEIAPWIKDEEERSD